MKSSVLKHIRTVFSVLVLLLFAFIFIDFRGSLEEKAFSPILYIQFIPSLLKFIIAGAVTATGFIVVIILTLLTGRTYCSFLCPLGILQDVISRIGGLIKRRYRRYGYKKPYTVLRYFILILTAGIMLLGGVYVLTILDPYSIFGRFMTYFVKPFALILNNFLASILGKFDIYTLYKVDVNSYKLAAYIIPSGFLLLIGLLALQNGRLYCNTVCPVGTFLGLLSKFSLFRIRFDEEKCSRCGRCATACKSSCIDFLNKHVDLSRCVNCFNCIDSCKENGISYGPVRIKHSVKDDTSKTDTSKTDTSRRNFISGSILLMAGGSQLLRGQDTTSLAGNYTTVKEDRLYPATPPGSVSIESFISRCTACSLCVTQCPTGVLQPSVQEYGVAGIMQPRMDFHSGFCNYDCNRCSNICPSGAIMPLAIEAKKLTQVGKAVFIMENCVVHRSKTACGACSEHCPTKACHMVPYEGNLVIPEIRDEICIGCGACEYICPTRPFRAIFVDGNPIHEAAVKPETEEHNTVTSDFPF